MSRTTGIAVQLVAVIVGSFAVNQCGAAGSPTAAVLSAKLRSESRCSFERGLMPLPDYLEDLALAETGLLQSVSVDADSNPWPRLESAQLNQVLRLRLSDLRNAVDRLQRFQQPAAAGWASDLALAEYALIDAEWQAAFLTGATSKIHRLARDRQQAAAEHYRRRLVDYQILGHASLPQLADSILLLNVAPQTDIQFLQAATAKTRAWSIAKAGIGRDDELLAERLRLTESRAGLARADEDVSALAVQLRDADRLAAEMLTAQQTHYRTGTSSLADLTRSWQWRWRLQATAQRLEIPISPDAERDLSTSLAEITQISRQVSDRRGRMLADVMRVELLRQLQRDD